MEYSEYFKPLFILLAIFPVFTNFSLGRKGEISFLNNERLHPSSKAYPYQTNN